MSMQIQTHAYDSLSDATLPGECPQEPRSTWTIDVVGMIEPSGLYAETVDHNRDMAKGLLDPADGYLPQDAFEDERFSADALLIAAQGGVRTYAQEQGWAPLVLEPELWQDRDGNTHANADAYAAVAAERSGAPTVLDTPDEPSFRHFRDVPGDEQLAGLTAFDAETHDIVDPDALVEVVNDPHAMREGGITPTTQLDGIQLCELDELLGEQGAADYFGHLYQMAEQQLEEHERELQHSRACRARHPQQWVDSRGFIRTCSTLRTKRTDAAYRQRTARWRKQAAERNARLAARSPYTEPQPGHIGEGRLEIPSDPAWRRTHGNTIVYYLREWYPQLAWGSPEWKDAAQHVYYALRAARSPAQKAA